MAGPEWQKAPEVSEALVAHACLTSQKLRVDLPKFALGQTALSRHWRNNTVGSASRFHPADFKKPGQLLPDPKSGSGTNAARGGKAAQPHSTIRAMERGVRRRRVCR